MQLLIDNDVESNPGPGNNTETNRVEVDELKIKSSILTRNLKS